jgi:hypothetical protein
MQSLIKSIIAFLLVGTLAITTTQLFAQADSSGTFWKPKPRNYEVTQAFEVESLFPMYFYGGYHIGIGYRYKKFRIRVSVINGGNYNVDGQAIGNVDEGYKRYYTTSPGIFLGYNTWKNLELYGYYERHTFKVKQVSTGEKQDIPSNDIGIGISYQFFIGRYVYIQPGIHSYFRSEKTVNFSNNQSYSIPTFELSPIVRLGVRLWRKY